MAGLTPAGQAALRYVAARLGVPTAWLEAVINFETAGTWNPLIKNPNSSARGLIQFLDATARGLGFQSALDLVTRHNTVESQLRGPVLQYFQQFKTPAKSAKEFYFRVFLPAYANSPLDTVIYAADPVKQAAFRKANPGIQTVGDYYRKLESRFAKFRSGPGGAGVVAVLALMGFFLGRAFFK